jgi:hypothetical protein
LNFDIILNGTRINYIKKEVGYYIIIILNIIEIKLDVDIVDSQDYGNLSNIEDWGGYSTKTARHKFRATPQAFDGGEYR